MDLNKLRDSKYKDGIKEVHDTAEQLRRDGTNPEDASLADVVMAKYQVSEEAYLADLGIDPSRETIHAMQTVKDVDVRWIIPEIFRRALVLGYRAAPIYPNIIAGEEQMKGLKQKMPYINMSDAAPRKVGESETIPLGAISYGEKEFEIYKIGRGISITYEVQQYSSLNLVSRFLEDFGVKLGHAMDTLVLTH